MSTTTVTRGLVFALTWIGAATGHAAGDYLVQLDTDARHKQDHTRPAAPTDPADDRTPARRTRDGHRALARHVLTYGASQTVTKTIAYRASGVRVPWYAQLAGAATETALHALIDDGRLLRAYARAAGKIRFHDLADGGVNGRMLLDQAAHQSLQLLAGALATTLLTPAR